MNVNLEKKDINLILDAMESYQLHINHWTNSRTIKFNVYPWSETEVEKLTKYLRDMVNDE